MYKLISILLAAICLICVSLAEAPSGDGKKTLTEADILLLTEKGKNLTWYDFEPFRHGEDTGSGVYIVSHEAEFPYTLIVGGGTPPEGAISYAYLYNVETDIIVDLVRGETASLQTLRLLNGRNFYGSFTPNKTYSFDRRFYAVQEVKNRMIEVIVYDAQTKKTVGSFSPARAMDFWGICWEKDTYNLWTQSADIGEFCYEYQNGNWVRNEEMKLPDYIISRYDKVYRSISELQEGMYRSPE